MCIRDSPRTLLVTPLLFRYMSKHLRLYIQSHDTLTNVAPFTLLRLTVQYKLHGFCHPGVIKGGKQQDTKERTILGHKSARTNNAAAGDNDDDDDDDW